jgi:hypothetical protein
MVDVRTRAARPPTHAQVQRQERLARIREASATPRARVVPTTDGYRRLLKHPSGVGFRASGSSDWPLDKFTRRRIADGSIRLEDAAAGEAAPPPAEPPPSEPAPADYGEPYAEPAPYPQ